MLGEDGKTAGKRDRDWLDGETQEAGVVAGARFRRRFIKLPASAFHIPLPHTNVQPTPYRFSPSGAH